jgi:hypothetical protein
MTTTTGAGRVGLYALVICAGCGSGEATPIDEPVPPLGPPKEAAEICATTVAAEGAYPDAGAWEPNLGSGAPNIAFSADQLMTACAFLDGGPDDTSDHHNLLSMYEGYLLMPWAPEWAGGGITLWDVSEPCSPAVVGTGFSREMRETHSIGYSSLNGRWAAVNHLGAIDVGGVQFWDMADVTAPTAVSSVDVEGFFYPDAYARVSLSVFWQVPYVYVAAADNGIFVVDATDPTVPTVVAQVPFEPVLRAGQVQAVGDLLVVSEAEGPRTVLLDISNPTEPQPIGGGDFLIADGQGITREAYFSNLHAGHVIYARKDDGGGVIMYDVRDPHTPTFAGDVTSDGNGGYVFVKDDIAYVGEGRFAATYDVSDPSNIVPLSEGFELEGDLDTITPIANFVVLSVDDEAAPDQGSAIVPHELDPDTRGPSVTWIFPRDGAADLTPTSKIGVMFSELVDVKSAWEGSVRLWDSDAGPEAGRVVGLISAQENIVSFVPRCALEPGHRYTLEIPVGGVSDFSGNATSESFQATFTVAGGS